MKKIYTALLCIVSLNGLTQTPKWFVSFATGFNVGGPSVSIKSEMKNQGFDDKSEFNFFGWTGTSEYPYKSQEPSLLLRFGKQISEKKLIYFVIGRLDKATVKGFRNDGYSDLLGLFGSSSGPRPYINYSLYQLTAGYLYTNAKSRIKLGVGPSVYLLNYKDELTESNSFTAGAAATAIFPLRKAKRKLGFDFIIEANLAPPVKIESRHNEEVNQFKMKSANMV
ncbi:MAG: hypothetical protein ACXWCZ_13725, partial [Flavisolibacter sp.]